MKTNEEKSRTIRYISIIYNCIMNNFQIYLSIESANFTYYGEMNRSLKVRSGKHNRIAPVTFKKIKPLKESTICNHLLNCNNIPSFKEFAILANRNNKVFLEINESFLIKRDRPILNRNISSQKRFLFDNI